MGLIARLRECVFMEVEKYQGVTRAVARTISGRYLVFCVCLALVFSGCVSQEELAKEFVANRRSSYALLSRTDTREAGLDQLELLSGALTIDECIDIALKHNKDVQTARVKLIEAKGRTTEAVATALPTGSFTGYAGLKDSDIMESTKDSYELGVLLRQPLYLGGLAATAIDAATVYAYMSQQELRQSIQELKRRVRQLYFDALLASELESVGRQAKRDAQKHLEDVRKKYKYGVGTRFDVLRAEVRLNGVEADLIKHQNGASVAVISILNELGVSQLSQIELGERLEYEPVAVLADSCLPLAMERRAELLIGEAMVRLAEDNIKGELSTNKPKVYLQGAYRRNNPAIGSSDNGRYWDRTIEGAIAVEWLFFDGFRSDGRVVQARAERHRQLLGLRKTQEQVQMEVTRALLNLDSSERFVESQEGTVDNAEEALRLANVNFREGAGTSLDVISAEVALSSARSDYITAVHHYELSLLSLHAAIGTIGEESVPLEE